MNLPSLRRDLKLVQSFRNHERHQQDTNNFKSPITCIDLQFFTCESVDRGNEERKTSQLLNIRILRYMNKKHIGKQFPLGNTLFLVITRPDTRHKMRLVCVLFTFENNTGHTDRRTDGRTDGRTQLLIEMRRHI